MGHFGLASYIVDYLYESALKGSNCGYLDKLIRKKLMSFYNNEKFSITLKSTNKVIEKVQNSLANHGNFRKKILIVGPKFSDSINSINFDYDKLIILKPTDNSVNELFSEYNNTKEVIFAYSSIDDFKNRLLQEVSINYSLLFDDVSPFRIIRRIIFLINLKRIGRVYQMISFRNTFKLPYGFPHHLLRVIMHELQYNNFCTIDIIGVDFYSRKQRYSYHYTNEIITREIIASKGIKFSLMNSRIKEFNNYEALLQHSWHSLLSNFHALRVLYQTGKINPINEAKTILEKSMQDYAKILEN